MLPDGPAHDVDPGARPYFRTLAFWPQHLIPDPVILQVVEEHLGLDISVCLGVKAEEQFRRKLPKSVATEIIGGEDVNDLSADGAQAGHIFKALWCVVDVFQTAEVNHGVVLA